MPALGQGCQARIQREEESLDSGLLEQLEAWALAYVYWDWKIVQGLNCMMEQMEMIPNDWTSAFSCDDGHCDVSWRAGDASNIDH